MYCWKVKNAKGQVAVEYILLIIVGVAIWILLMTQLVSRNPQSPGIMIRKWSEINQWIGQDRVEP